MAAPEQSLEGRARSRRRIDDTSALKFLSQATRELSLSTDYEDTLLAVAGMALPYLGSWCIVDLLRVDGSMRRLGIIHPDPDKQVHATRLTRSWPPHRNDPLGLPRALLARASEVIPEVPDERLVEVARSEENLRDLRALGIGSVLVVPLLPRGHMLGAITFVSAATGHQYGESDVALAEELGARCGVAVDNARLLREAEEARAQAEEARAQAEESRAQVEEARRRVVQLNERLVMSSLRQQELTEAAEDANRVKTRFLSTMSHEIRTPINGIIGYMDLLELDLGEPTPRQIQYMKRMRSSSDHLIGLTENILDLTKIEAGRVDLKRTSVPAMDSATAAVSMVEPRAMEVGVDVRIDCPDESVVYRGDGDRVRQILVSLLTNALKYTDRGGSVVVRCGPATTADAGTRLRGGGPWTFIRVEDTGIGIAAASSASVFEPFVQIDVDNVRKQSGAGLGLSIALELARQMGGDLTLRSVLGEGSCFTLWLPAATPDSDTG